MARQWFFEVYILFMQSIKLKMSWEIMDLNSKSL